MPQADSQGGRPLPVPALVPFPAGVDRPIWAAQMLSYKWFDVNRWDVERDQGMPLTTPRARFLLALEYMVYAGEKGDRSEAATRAGINPGTARSWLSRDENLRRHADGILAGEARSGEWYRCDVDLILLDDIHYVRALEAMPGIADDVASIRSGRGPSAEFEAVLGRAGREHQNREAAIDVPERTKRASRLRPRAPGRTADDA